MVDQRQKLEDCFFDKVTLIEIIADYLSVPDNHIEIDRSRSIFVLRRFSSKEKRRADTKAGDVRRRTSHRGIFCVTASPDQSARSGRRRLARATGRGDPRNHQAARRSPARNRRRTARPLRQPKGSRRDRARAQRPGQMTLTSRCARRIMFLRVESSHG